MRKYFSTLHQRSESHRRHFALAVSSIVTLSIFSFWSLATFGTGGTLAQNDPQPTTNNRSMEVSPFESFKNGLAASLEGLSGALSSTKDTLKEAVDLEADYQKMRDGVLNTYGQ